MADDKLSSWTFPTTSTVQRQAHDESRRITLSQDRRSPQMSPSSTEDQGLHRSIAGLSLTGPGSHRDGQDASRMPYSDKTAASIPSSSRSQPEPSPVGRQSASPSSPFTAVTSSRTTMSPLASSHTTSPSVASGFHHSLKGLHRHSTSHTAPWQEPAARSDCGMRQMELLAQHRRSESRLGDARHAEGGASRSINDHAPLNDAEGVRMSSADEHSRDPMVTQATGYSSQLPGQHHRPGTFSEAFVSEDREEDANESPETSTLWMGDLEAWMDENYIRRCIAALGWDRDSAGGVSSQINVKIIKSASTSSMYCFVTFPTSEMARNVLAQMADQPPMLMPGSERTFKLNWATGLPGVQPKWESEFSVFVGDIGRETTEAELVALFSPLFPSTKSAKIMLDAATGSSKGYGFIRFGSEDDMRRSLALGQSGSSGTGLSLRGRTLRISEASGPSSATPRRAPNTTSIGTPHMNAMSGQPSIRSSLNGVSAGMPGSADVQHTPAGSFAPQYGGSYEGMPNFAGSSIFSSLPQATLANSQSPIAPYFTQPEAGPSKSAVTPSSDPNNTTVFIGGLPALITEDTLRSFFQHFGEIAYVKVPPNKGCGFVQFVMRQDAELAIAKMHDFPIHGKSRIRLSWGRSQSDKQVEHVRKLANAMNVPFETAWKMVQGQDHMAIKQIAAAVSQSAGQKSRGPEAARAEMMSLGMSQNPPALYSPSPMAAASLYQNLPPTVSQMGMTTLAYPPSAYNFAASLPPSMINPAYAMTAGSPYTTVPAAAFAPLSASAIGMPVMSHHVAMAHPATNTAHGQYVGGRYRSPAVASSSGSSEVKAVAA